MEGTDIYFIDGRIDYDHTYYGNGCPNSWGGSDGSGGSVTSCSTRMIKTSDNEDQKNGTYYIFQAATVGSGAAITTDNTNSPDTFCPLGWQLPYGGTGGDYYDKTRSWNYLIESNNISVDSSAGSEQLRSYPLSFASGGIYYWGTGRLYYQTVLGYYWSSTNNLRGMAYRMTIPYGSIILNETNAKSTGNTIRCAYMLSIPFIDGTVAGIPEDLTIYKDSSTHHDHTYYGNGCTGSVDKTSPCSSRLVKTPDELETQKNGTYYHYQAITAGSGDTVSDDNILIPDSFCPLGWQLPYGGTGGDYYDQPKSWKYLMETYSLVSGQDGSIAIQSYPIRLTRGGILQWTDGALGYMGGVGQYWTSINATQAAAYRFNFWTGDVIINSNVYKAQSQTVRCVLGISNLKALHGIRVRL